MHYTISTKILGQTHMWNGLKHIRTNFWIFHFLCGFGFFTHTKQRHKSKIKKQKQKTMHIKRCKMHKCMINEASNAWKVLQRSKELDQGPKEYKLNHRNPSSSKWNNFLEWVSHEKWNKG